MTNPKSKQNALKIRHSLILIHDLSRELAAACISQKEFRNKIKWSSDAGSALLIMVAQLPAS
ncbi:MAG: hypothetical protein ACI9S8_000235 [Chlamydiales bacterium]|jgi:hypothetical protein